MVEEKSLRGADVVIRTLEDLGVEYVFGYPGGAALPLFEALYHSSIQLVLARHEQGATHMADGYARASGKVGVVLVTSGPGATNTVTGIYTAQMDSSPLLVLCGQVSSQSLGTDAFQEVDVFGLTLPVVKHNYLVTQVGQLQDWLIEAYTLAGAGRPGPVVMDLPKDVTAAKAPAYRPHVYRPIDSCHLRGDPELDSADLDRAVQVFRQARRPLLLVGQGAVLSGAHSILGKWVETLCMPVTQTLLGKGALSEDHPLCLGMLGMHGTAYANKAVTQCDLICSIGSRWDDRIVGQYERFCPQAKKIHIDIDPTEIDKVVRPDVWIVGDAKHVLEDLFERLSQGPKPDTRDWCKTVFEMKRQFPLAVGSSPTGKPTARQVIDELYQLTQGQAVVTTDVGQHQMWAAQFFRVHRPRTWITSGGAGTMGFGFPAACGAQLACPKQMVWALVGDGGFQMTSSELATAVNYKLPVKVLILDNGFLGMVRQWQELFFEGHYSGVEMVGNPDFAQLGRSYGAKAFILDQSDSVHAVLSEALKWQKGPCLIHAKIEPEENVYPMVPSGKPLEDMILEPKARS